jgi:type I restriction enzyme S subunit
MKSTAQPAYNVSAFKDLAIPFMTKREQLQLKNEIESRLSVCDNILANIEEGLEKSEALRQSILKLAFEGKLLSEKELEACRKEPDWEPAEALLERIKKEKTKVLVNG